MMRSVTGLLVLLGAASSALADPFPLRRSFNDARNAAPARAAPRRYIVELNSRAQCSKAITRIASAAGLRVVKQFDSDIFPGVAVECERGCSDEFIKATLNGGDNGPIVVSVYQSTVMQLLPTAQEESFSDDAAASNYSVHGSTGVEALHEAGILGAGATVAIVDSGVQYTHPALGGGIGPNFTVIGGYDLVGKDWPDVPAQPDNDPMDEYGHGTHVAGIIAGKSDQFVGVAPAAKLLSFKVFGDSGYSNEETVIEGFLMAYDSGADIISASLGEGSGFTTNALAVVASRIVDQGVVVVIAAGNSGQDGPFMASNGASGKNVLTVAAAEPGEFPAQTFSADFHLDGTSNVTDIAYIAGSISIPNTVVDWPIYPLTLNYSVEVDACVAIPANTSDLRDVVVLVRMGGCGISVKQKNLAPLNAQYILFYNDDGPVQNPATSGSSGTIGAIEARAGEAIVKAILAGGNVTATFNGSSGHYVGLYNAGGGRPALYTSWGGTYDLALKPDIAAPGSKILSTYPTDAYTVLSGSSMATPYISGVAALWVSQFGGRAKHQNDPAWAKRLIARIISTGRAVPWADWATTATDYGFWAPTTQVGAGFVDAARVLNYTTEFNFAGRKFELNDTANFIGTHSLEITNHANEAVTYTFSLQDAGGYDSYIPAVPGKPQTFVPEIKLYGDINPVKMIPQAAIPEGDFIVGPGETKTAEFTFTVPAGLNSSNLPVYTGKILVSGSNGEELGVPYFGVGSDIRHDISNIWDYGSNFPYLTSTALNIMLAQKSNFTFNLTKDSQDFPKLNAQFAWGTKEFRWDIFDSNYTESDWTYPPVIGEKGYVGSATSWNGTSESQWFVPGEDSEDDIFSFPLYNQPRSRWGIYYWLGRFANGSQIQPGSYKFRLATLLPFGQPEVAGDWDIWQTPNITVLPLN